MRGFIFEVLKSVLNIEIVIEIQSQFQYSTPISIYRSYALIRATAKVRTSSPKVTVNKVEILRNKKLCAALNPVAVFNLERLLSARLWYLTQISTP